MLRFIENVLPFEKPLILVQKDAGYSRGQFTFNFYKYLYNNFINNGLYTFDTNYEEQIRNRIVNQSPFNYFIEPFLNSLARGLGITHDLNTISSDKVKMNLDIAYYISDFLLLNILGFIIENYIIIYMIKFYIKFYYLIKNYVT